MMVVAIMKFEKFNKIQINKSINNLSPLPGRRQFITTKDKGMFIIDYAHTVEAYRSLFREISVNQRLLHYLDVAEIEINQRGRLLED